MFKIASKIGSIAVRAAALYFLYWSTFTFSFFGAEVLTGYTYPDNPIESDYPVPALYNLAIVCGPYIFWFLMVTAYDLTKNARKYA